MQDTNDGHSKAKWADLLGVSRSGYYSRVHEREQRSSRQAAYEAHVKEIFEAGRGHYGAKRICGVIRQQGGHASFPVVKRIMESNGLISSHCRRKCRSLTDSSKARDERYKNLLTDLEITRPFQALSSDIIYIRTDEGFDYLCQIRDVYTNPVLGYCQQSRMTKDIVLKALRAALKRRDCPRGTIFHSDRGSQYTAHATQQLLSRFGFNQSFSGVGKPADNTWSESFFANMKKEIIHWNHFRTRDEARQTVFTYIETYYNRQREQKRFGFLSPIEYLKQWQKDNQAICNVA